MDNPFQKSADHMKNVRLTENEKKVMRNELLQFMNDNPADEWASHEVPSEEHPGVFESLFTILISKSAPAMLVLCLVATGGGVSFASNAALPGDFLYPVKVNVNEEVRSLLTFKDESKVEWEIERSERRLEEAEILEERGEFDEEVRELIADQLEEHTEFIDEVTEEIEEEKRIEVALELEERLEEVLEEKEEVLVKVLDTRPMIAVAPERAALEVEILEIIEDLDVQTEEILPPAPAAIVSDVPEEIEEEEAIAAAPTRLPESRIEPIIQEAVTSFVLDEPRSADEMGLTPLTDLIRNHEEDIEPTPITIMPVTPDLISPMPVPTIEPQPVKEEQEDEIDWQSHAKTLWGEVEQSLQELRQRLNNMQSAKEDTSDLESLLKRVESAFLNGQEAYRSEDFQKAAHYFESALEALN